MIEKYKSGDILEVVYQRQEYATPRTVFGQLINKSPIAIRIGFTFWKDKPIDFIDIQLKDMISINKVII